MQKEKNDTIFKWQDEIDKIFSLSFSMFVWSHTVTEAILFCVKCKIVLIKWQNSHICQFTQNHKIIEA